MTPGMQPGQAPGVVEVRLLGEPEDIKALIGLLAEVEGAAVAGRVAMLSPGGNVLELPAIELLDRSGPRVNRHDPGERVYLTVRVRTEV